MQAHLASSRDVGLLKSRSFISLDASSLDDKSLLGAYLVFKLRVTEWLCNKTGIKLHTTTGTITSKTSSGSSQIGTLSLVDSTTTTNPVLGYLMRHDKPIEEAIPLNHPIYISFIIGKVVPKQRGGNEYSKASGDYNPIHTCDVFASFCGFSGPIRHGMQTSATIHTMLQKWAGVNSTHKYEVTFMNVLYFNESIEVTFEHVAMIAGRKVITIEARTKVDDKVVLQGRAEVEETSVYVFTGQGSQHVNMGADLIKSSVAAREIWNRADDYFLNDLFSSNSSQLR